MELFGCWQYCMMIWSFLMTLPFCLTLKIRCKINILAGISQPLGLKIHREKTQIMRLDQEYDCHLAKDSVFLIKSMYYVIFYTWSMSKIIQTHVQILVSTLQQPQFVLHSAPRKKVRLKTEYIDVDLIQGTVFM